MKKTLHLLIALLGAAALTAQSPGGETQTFDLSQAIEYALANHNNMKYAAMDVAAAEAQSREYTAIGIPKLEANLDYQYYPNIPVSVLPDFISPVVDGRLLQLGIIDPSQVNSEVNFFPAKFGTNNRLSGSLDFSALVFDGSYFVGLRAIKGLKDLNKSRVGAARQDIRLNVTKAYYTVLATRIGLETLDKNIANLDKLLGETKAFQKAGFVEQLDVDRLDLSLRNLRSERDIVARQQETALNLLKFQMGYPMDQGIQIAGSVNEYLGEPSQEDLSGGIVYSNRIEYELLNKQLKLNDLNIERYQVSYYPSVFAFASYSQVLLRNNLFNNSEVGFNPTSVIGLSVKAPIFDGFDRKAKIDRAKIDRDRVGLQIGDFERAMMLQVMNARTTYVNARARLDDRRATVELAQRIYGTTQIKVREGVGSSLELNAAERELYAAQANFLNAVYDCLVAKADLEYALGNLDN
jgi:outer membrane protein TolC